MGGGSWTSSAYTAYSTTRGRTVTTDGLLHASYTSQDLFTARRLDPALNPKNVMRECCDSEEHPNTVPVILALDVTGSMGSAAADVAKKLNMVMTELYDRVADVEFLIMGIGDLAYDHAPIQASQFESDIRIAEQLDKVYFEYGGGGNAYESYTAAWYFGVRHTSLDCWKRGKKGIIITMGDEPLNPYLPHVPLSAAMGDSLQGDVDTKDLYEEVIDKFDVYHLAVDDRATSYCYYDNRIAYSFGAYLDADHLRTVTLDNIAAAIISIVERCSKGDVTSEPSTNSEIAW